MKKILSTAFFALLVSFVFAQIKVVAPNGDVGIGTSNPTEKLDVDGLVKSVGGTITQTGQSATYLFDRTDFAAMLLGAGGNAGFTFDNNYNFEIRSRGRNAILNRQLSAGSMLLRGDGGTGFIGMVGINNPSTALHVGGSITYSGSITNASDKRLKKEIKSFEMGLKEVLKLNPVRYNYTGDAGTSSKERHTGLLAQELNEIAPELVSSFVYQTEDELGKVLTSKEYLKINESSIKYMLVNAVQEQQQIIEEQNEEIEFLNERLERLEELVSDLAQSDNRIIELNGAKGAILQNKPNPFNGTTTIQYSINEDAKSASIQIANTLGQVMKTIKVDNSSKGELVIKESDLAAGNYSYSLIIDGKVIETKKMVVAK